MRIDDNNEVRNLIDNTLLNAKNGLHELFLALPPDGRDNALLIREIEDLEMQLSMVAFLASRLVKDKSYEVEVGRKFNIE